VTQSTGWRPERSVRQIVEEVCAWLEEHRRELEPILG
jgi:nucleoside-diphosphate-sugar epimerase